MRVLFPALLMALTVPGIAMAADAAVDCSTARPAIPAGWATKVALAAAPGAIAGLEVGRAAEMRLMPAGGVAYPVAPAKPVAAGTYGGIAAFSVPRAGNYRVSLGAAAWIDVVRGPAVVASSAHGHGPACTGIRKTVDFPLKQGRHLIEISESKEPTIALMVTRLP